MTPDILAVTLPERVKAKVSELVAHGYFALTDTGIAELVLLNKEYFNVDTCIRCPGEVKVMYQNWKRIVDLWQKGKKITESSRLTQIDRTLPPLKEM